MQETYTKVVSVDLEKTVVDVFESGKPVEQYVVYTNGKISPFFKSIEIENLVMKTVLTAKNDLH